MAVVRRSLPCLRVWIKNVRLAVIEIWITGIFKGFLPTQTWLSAGRYTVGSHKTMLVKANVALKRWVTNITSSSDNEL